MAHHIDWGKGKSFDFFYATWEVRFLWLVNFWAEIWSVVDYLLKSQSIDLLHDLNGCL